MTSPCPPALFSRADSLRSRGLPMYDGRVGVADETLSSRPPSDTSWMDRIEVCWECPHWHEMAKQPLGIGWCDFLLMHDSCRPTLAVFRAVLRGQRKPPAGCSLADLNRSENNGYG